jgi:DNA repair protein RadC
MRRSIRSLNTHSDRGHIAAPTPTFSCGFMRESASGYEPVCDEAVVEEALRIMAQRVSKGSALTSPSEVKQYLQIRFAGLQHEVFTVIYLTNRHHVIACEELFRGTIDGASVHPREVVKAALRHNAAAVLLAHNHPSGVSEPSHADELITRRLREALQLVEIRVLDHLVVGVDVVVSLAERGLI